VSHSLYPGLFFENPSKGTSAWHFEEFVTDMGKFNRIVTERWSRPFYLNSFLTRILAYSWRNMCFEGTWGHSVAAKLGTHTSFQIMQ
jgi:hypothetical protein